MVAKRQCSFCAQEIEPGTGTIFVKRDGTVYQFCSSSCRKQQLHLGRIGHRFKWTRAYALKRAAERSTVERGGGSAPAARPVPPRRAEPKTTPSGPPTPSVGAEAASEAPAPPPPKKPRAKGPAKSASKSAAKPPTPTSSRTSAKPDGTTTPDEA